MLTFQAKYPSKLPKCEFTPTLFHPNVFPSGTVCLSILKEEVGGWRPEMKVVEISQGIQMLLDEVNLDDAAQSEPYQLKRDSRAGYDKRIKAIVAKQRREDGLPPLGGKQA